LTSVFHASALLLIMNVVIIKLSNQGSVGSRSLTHHISYKFICLSTYWQWKSANERVRISAVIVKYTVHRFDPNIADHLCSNFQQFWKQHPLVHKTAGSQQTFLGQKMRHTKKRRQISAIEIIWNKKIKNLIFWFLLITT